MIWHDVWIVKAENFGQEKLEQEATELDRPCFFTGYSVVSIRRIRILCLRCFFIFRHSFHWHPMSYMSRLRHQELLRRHQFTLEDSLERLDGLESKQKETKERGKAKALRSWDQTVSGLLPCCEGCWSYSPPCSLPIGGGIEDLLRMVSTKMPWNARIGWKLRLVICLSACNSFAFLRSKHGEGRGQKQEKGWRRWIFLHVDFFVSVLFLGFRACFLIADGSDARWTWGVMLMSSSSSNCRVCRTNSRNWNVNAVSALPRLPNKSSQRRQSQRTPDFSLQLRPGRARSRQSRQSRSKKSTPTAPPAASHRRRSLQTRGATSKPRRQKLQPPLRGCPSLTCRKGMLQCFFWGKSGPVRGRSMCFHNV